MSDTPWMDWMRSHIGEVEKTGAIATAFDKEVFSHTWDDSVSKTGVMDEGCAATACAALEETGFKSPHSPRAADFIAYGAACELKPGALVVFCWQGGPNKGGHHVAFLDQISGVNVISCLGGNQSGHVQVSDFLKCFIIAVRWPIKA